MLYDRQKFYDAAKSRLETNIFYRSLALEACMGEMYDYLNQAGLFNPTEPAREDWTLAGLVHDIDYSGEFKEDHPHKTKEALAKFDLEISDIVFRIVQCHAWRITQVEPKNKAEWTIFCADSLTGLITAVALILPSKKLADVKLSSVTKRFLKEPKFAAGTRREEVSMCSRVDGLNLPLEKFIEICLTAMQKISGEIGL